MLYLKQSTAVDVMLGVFVDDTDGKTTEEALTLAQADLQLSKNCGAAAQKNDATSATHIYGGNYKVPLNTTDTGTLGRLDLMCKESGALPIKASFMIVTANIYDTLCSTDQLDVNITNIAGTSQTANDNGADINSILTDTGTTLDTLIKDIPTVAEFNARSILSADYVVTTDTIAGVTLCTTCTTNTDMVGTDGANTTTPDVAGTAAALHGTTDGKIDTVDGVVDNILVDTTRIFDGDATADGGSPTTGSLTDVLRRLKWFVSNLWEIDENETPNTFKIFKDDGLTTGLDFTVYTDSSKSYRDNTP